MQCSCYIGGPSLILRGGGCNRPLFPFSSFQPFTRRARSLSSFPSFAARPPSLLLLFICAIFSFPSIACSRPPVFPFFVFPSMPLLFDAHRLRAAALPLRAPLLRSRPVPCVRYARSASASLARICVHALVFICARALSHLPLYSLLRSRPVPCVRYASRIHSTLVAVAFD